MKKNNLLATVLAVIGGFIFSLPWFFLYVYKEVSFGILAFLIPIGFYLVYVIFKGDNHKYLIKMIVSESILIVVITNFLIIPLMLFHIEGVPVNTNVLKLLLRYPVFRNQILIDTSISLLFAILGSITIYFINKKRK